MNYKEKINQYLRNHRNTLIMFGILFCIYILALSALIRANINYRDDMGRVFAGYRQWTYFSRYISYIMSLFIHTDFYLADVSPLPQIIAVIIIVCTSLLVIKIITKKDSIGIIHLFAVLPLGLSPYFLTCLSYKYDAPYMAISVLFSILPLRFYKENIRIKYFILVFFSTLGVMMSYQVSAGIFPMLVVLLSVLEWSRGEKIKNVLKFIGISAVGYIAGLGIFRLFIMRPANGDYAATSIPEFSQIIPQTLSNYKKYISLIKSDLKTEWLVLIIIIAILFLFTVTKNSLQKKPVAFLVTGISLVVMFLLSFGIYPILETPLYNPRAMYGFGVFIAFISIVAVSYKMSISKIAAVLLGWCFIVFALIYGNAWHEQQQYVDFRITQVIDDLNDLENVNWDETVNLQLSGQIEYAPVLQNMPKDYNILNRLIPITFKANYKWGEFEFYNYYGMKNVKQVKFKKEEIQDLSVEKDTMYHRIYSKGQNILVRLK